MEGPAEEWRRIGRYEQHPQQRQQRQEVFRQHQLVQEHQQYYLQQKRQQLQQQQHRQQQYQQRLEMFRYRQEKQQQYHSQQQQEIFWRQQHLQHCQPETAKKTSEAQVQARADGEEAQAERSGALPSSQTTLKPQSLNEYSAMMLSVSQPVFREDRSTQDAQLDVMENGMLQPPQEWKEKKRQLRAIQLLQRSAPREPEAKSRDDRVASVPGYDTAHTREEHKPLPRRQQPIPRADESFLVLAQMRLPALACDEEAVMEDDNVVVDGGAFILDDGLLIFVKGEQADRANADAQEEDSQQLEQQSQPWPPLLQQQQELLAPPPQEPWPPPIMAAEHGSGAGGSGESCLELGRKDTFCDGGCWCDDSGGFSGGNEESDTTDGGDWERAGIGTGASSRAFWGCEVAGRRLTRLRRARVREK